MLSKRRVSTETNKKDFEMAVKFFDLNMGQLPTVVPLLVLPEIVLMPEGKFSIRLTDIKQISMILWTLAHGRFVAILQKDKYGQFYQIGSAARVSGFMENDDDSLTLYLTGVCRFCQKGLVKSGDYDMVQVDYKPFAFDFLPENTIDTKPLLDELALYLKKKRIDADMRLFEKFSTRRLIATLVSILPFALEEKQALLESGDAAKSVQTLLAILKMEAVDPFISRRGRKC